MFGSPFHRMGKEQRHQLSPSVVRRASSSPHDMGRSSSRNDNSNSNKGTSGDGNTDGGSTIGFDPGMGVSISQTIADGDSVLLDIGGPPSSLSSSAPVAPDVVPSHVARDHPPIVGRRLEYDNATAVDTMDPSATAPPSLLDEPNGDAGDVASGHFASPSFRRGLQSIAESLNSSFDVVDEYGGGDVDKDEGFSQEGTASAASSNLIVDGEEDDAGVDMKARERALLHSSRIGSPCSVGGSVGGNSSILSLSLRASQAYVDSDDTSDGRGLSAEPGPTSTQSSVQVSLSHSLPNNNILLERSDGPVSLAADYGDLSGDDDHVGLNTKEAELLSPVLHQIIHSQSARDAAVFAPHGDLTQVKCGEYGLGYEYQLTSNDDAPALVKDGNTGNIRKIGGGTSTSVADVLLAQPEVTQQNMRTQAPEPYAEKKQERTSSFWLVSSLLFLGCTLVIGSALVTAFSPFGGDNDDGVASISAAGSVPRKSSAFDSTAIEELLADFVADDGESEYEGVAVEDGINNNNDNDQAAGCGVNEREWNPFVDIDGSTSLSCQSWSGHATADKDGEHSEDRTVQYREGLANDAGDDISAFEGVKISIEKDDTFPGGSAAVTGDCYGLSECTDTSDSENEEEGMGDVANEKSRGWGLPLALLACFVGAGSALTTGSVNSKVPHKVDGELAGLDLEDTAANSRLGDALRSPLPFTPSKKRKEAVYGTPRRTSARRTPSSSSRQLRRKSPRTPLFDTSSFDTSVYDSLSICELCAKIRERRSEALPLGDRETLIHQVTRLHVTELDSLLVPDLRDLCMSKGLDHRGRRYELVQRLVESGI